MPGAVHTLVPYLVHVCPFCVWSFMLSLSFLPMLRVHLAGAVWILLSGLYLSTLLFGLGWRIFINWVEAEFEDVAHWRDL